MSDEEILRLLEKLEKDQEILLKSTMWLLRAIVADESLKGSHTQSQAKEILERLENKDERLKERNED